MKYKTIFNLFSKKTRRQLAKEIFGESDTSRSQDKNNDNNKDDDKAITTDKATTDNVSDIRRKIYQYISISMILLF